MVKIENDVKLDFSDVLIKPKPSMLESRNDVILHTTSYASVAKHNIYMVPVFASNMDHTGTIKMAYEMSAESMGTVLHKFHLESDLRFFIDCHGHMITQNRVFISVGVSNDDMERLKWLKATFPQYNVPICVDIANGYSYILVDFVKEVRNLLPDSVIMAGNVCTPEGTRNLCNAGVDIVKLGIGPGSVCTTRKMTGVGYPQLSTILECNREAKLMKRLVCADGGCQSVGDIAKAFGAGADFVMLGGMLAGHEECNGDIVHKVDGQYKEFYGMSSEDAMKKHNGGMSGYRTAEGKKVLVPYRGGVRNTLKEIKGGLRSSCTYIGAAKLGDFSKLTTFVRVNNQLNRMYG